MSPISLILKTKKVVDFEKKIVTVLGKSILFHTAIVGTIVFLRYSPLSRKLCSCVPKSNSSHTWTRGKKIWVGFFKHMHGGTMPLLFLWGECWRENFYHQAQNVATLLGGAHISGK